ncbi:MAG: phosphodiester glycosidase family protein [Verrucomicrobiota bacterium]
MRISACLLPLVLLASCAPAPQRVSESRPPAARPIANAPTPAAAAPAVAQAPPPASPSSPAEATRVTDREISGIHFEGVAFDSRKHRLVVVDQPDGPGSRFADAEAAARARDGMAAVNAGFFTPEGEPLGLVMSNGERSGAWNSASSLGSGVWHGNSNSMAISRRESLGKSAALAMRELLQAGPMLVDRGSTVGGLDATKTSARTLILWDGGTRWWMGRAAPCSLAALGNALAHGQPAGWKVRHALNLDGGRSADLWVSVRISGGPLTRRTPWNRPVRNFLVLVPHG